MIESVFFFFFFFFVFFTCVVPLRCIYSFGSFLVGDVGLAEYSRTQLCDSFLESTYPTILWELLGSRGLVGVGGSDPNRPPPTGWKWRTGWWWGCDQFKYPIHFELCRPRRWELSWYVHKEVDKVPVRGALSYSVFVIVRNTERRSLGNFYFS